MYRFEIRLESDGFSFSYTHMHTIGGNYSNTTRYSTRPPVELTELNQYVHLMYIGISN